MSAVYQDVIEGYLIASIKVYSLKVTFLIYLNLNLMKLYPDKIPTILAGRLVHLRQFPDLERRSLELS